MNKLIKYFAVAACLLFVVFNGAASGQTDNTKIVGIDPAKNTVQLPNNAANPLSVKIENTAVRKPFQKRISVAPLGNGFSGAPLQIPAGKRLVIENVSVVGRVPDGMKLEVNFFTYMDNDGNGVNDPEDLTFHRIPMTEQGVFDGTAISAFNQKMLVFADGSSGSGGQAIVAQARLNALVPANTFTQVQFTFSGYLEDLPAAQ
jgi:hypothetical protein